MPRHKDDLGSREGLLQNSDRSPLRASLEEAYRSSVDEEDLDELDYLPDGDEEVHPRGRKVYDDKGIAYRTLPFTLNQNPARRSRLRNLCGRCRLSRRCALWGVAVFVAGITILGLSGFWVWKRSPAYGVHLLIFSSMTMG